MARLIREAEWASEHNGKRRKLQKQLAEARAGARGRKRAAGEVAEAEYWLAGGARTIMQKKTRMYKSWNAHVIIEHLDIPAGPHSDLPTGGVAGWGQQGGMSGSADPG